MKTILNPYILIIIILFIGTTLSAQEPDRKWTRTSELFTNNIAVSLNNDIKDSTSENDYTLLYISNGFDHTFTSGMRWGTCGALAGWLYARNECDGDLCGLYVPLGFTLGLIGGGIYTISSDIPEDFDASKYSFGFQWGNIGTIAKERKFWEDIGIVYRQPSKSFYIPNNYYLYYANGNSDYSSGSKSIFIDTKYGIELTRINYMHTYSLMYGLGLGYLSGEIINHIPEQINYKTYNSFQVDFRIGLNINILKYLHFQWFYKFEPFGPYNSFTHSVGGSLNCFYF